MKHLYIQFTAAPNGGEHIRKWSHERFDEANAYVFRIAGPDDVPADEVEVAARAAARSLGFDFDEVCGHETEAEWCDSSTCIGGMTEDHDPQFSRETMRKVARAALGVRLA